MRPPLLRYLVRRERLLEYPASSIHRFPYDIVFGNVLRVLVIPRFIQGLAHGGAPIRGID
jgi:hypothetical protein